MILWLEFAAVTALILFSGSRLTRYGDILAEKTGLSRLWLGVVLMAAVTSLPELASGLSAVLVARLPDIATGSILGSSAINIFFLGVLDVLSKEVPITARAHQRNILSAGLSLALMGVVAVGLAAGDVLPPLGWTGLYTPVIFLGYFASMRTVFLFEQRTASERPKDPLSADESAYYGRYTLSRAVFLYSVNAVLVVGAAVLLPGLAERISVATGLGRTFVGNIFVAVSTSLPELTVCVAALRINAVDMAFGNIFGSNLFNLLILALDDIFYFRGPLLAASERQHLIPALSGMAMTGLAVAGLLYNSRRKRFFLAWDSSLVVLFYLANVLLLYLHG
jgi:cation:H+ antiporter